jgi:DNA-directed RNA polymerase specialized sigma subunit
MNGTNEFPNIKKRCSRNATVESFIPYRPLSDSRKSELETLLRESNAILKSYNEKIPDMTRTELLASIAKGRRKFGEVIVAQKDATLMLRTKEVEMEVLCGYSRMINKVVNKWVLGSDTILSMEDLSSEAVAAGLSAVAHYLRDDIKFSTFLVKCVQNQLVRACDTATGISYDSLKLRRTYEKLRTREGATFDSIVKEMNITERQVKALQSTLLSVTTESSMPEDETFQPTDETNMPSEDAAVVRDVIRSLSLSRLEKIVVNVVMNSRTGELGLSKSCKGVINPDTNKPYSRAALSWAWRSAKKKIGDAIKAS